MAKNGRIAVDRSILNWRWYKNANTFRVFMHLLLTANYAPADYENIRLERGDVIVTYPGLGEVLGLSVREVRTAIEHLKSTGELTGKQYSKYQVISIVNYDSYQGSLTGKTAGKRQAIDNQSTGNRQLSNKKNNNNINNNIYIPPIVPLNGDGDDTQPSSLAKPFGEYGNVLIAEDEKALLDAEFPGRVDAAIKDLDERMELSERNKNRYGQMNHYLLIKRELEKVDKASRTCGYVPADDGRLSFDLEDVFERPC